MKLLDSIRAWLARGTVNRLRAELAAATSSFISADDERKELRVELEKAHEARRQAQFEASELKGRIARSRIDLRREMLADGWRPPAPKPSGEPE